MLRINKQVILVVKLILVAASFAFIIYRFYSFENFAEVIQECKEFTCSDYIFSLLVLIFVIINWMVESLKWKRLLLPVEKISLKRAFGAVLAGVTVSMFTPNRTGEFLGRVPVLEKAKRIDGIAATLIGSLSQLIVTLFIGIAGILYLILKQVLLPELFISWYLVFAISLVFFVAGMFLFLNIHHLIAYILRKGKLRKWHKYLIFIVNYNKRDLFKVLLLSLLRYMIFVLQFYLLFLILNVHLNFFNVFAGVGLMYFIMAVIPTFTIAELGLRGSVALLVFELFTTNVFAIVAASMLLWIVNLALPALIGALVFFKMKI